MNQQSGIQSAVVLLRHFLFIDESMELLQTSYFVGVHHTHIGKFKCLIELLSRSIVLLSKGISDGQILMKSLGYFVVYSRFFVGSIVFH